jgi:dienelactone hydrolase
MLLFELEDGDAFLAVGFGFGGTVGVDAAFREKVGAAACDYERGPAVAVGSLDQC